MSADIKPSKVICFNAYADFPYATGKDRGCDLQVRAGKALAGLLGNDALYLFPNTLLLGGKTTGEQMAVEFQRQNPNINPQNVIYYTGEGGKKVENTIDEVTALSQEAGELEKYMVSTNYHRRRVRIDAKRTDPKTTVLQAELLIKANHDVEGEEFIAELHRHPAYQWKTTYERLVTFVDQIPALGPAALVLVDRLTKKQLTL